MKLQNPEDIMKYAVNKENVDEIRELCTLINGSAPDELILYGNCPGLTYVTGIPRNITIIY